MATEDEAEESKRQIGRPSLYKPEYCDLAKEFMGKGFSLTAFAGEIGVSRDTVYAWEKEIPAFSDAIKVARAKRVGFLEVGLLGAESGPQVTSRIFALKNACADEWREKQDVEHSGEVKVDFSDEARVRALTAFLAKTAVKTD